MKPEEGSLISDEKPLSRGNESVLVLFDLVQINIFKMHHTI